MTREHSSPPIPTDKRAILAAYITACEFAGHSIGYHQPFGPGAAPVQPARPKRQRKPRLKTVLAQGKKAGATSVTIDGVTYAFSADAAAESNPFE